MQAGGNTGLEDPNIFYFGNATGDSTADGRVDANDVVLTRNNPHPFFDPAQITCNYDFDRDQRVDATDILLVRNNQTTFFNELNLIDLSGGKTASEIEKASALDAVFTKLRPVVAPTEPQSSAILAWLHEFEQAIARQRPSKVSRPLEAFVDMLLVDYGSGV
jgi:hypothetical protein